MSPHAGGTPRSETITVRYWASARAAAGTDEDQLAVEGQTSVADVVRRVLEARPNPRLADVLGVCSVLVGDRPVKGKDRESVMVRPGESVEFLPPFAGG